MLKGIFSMEGPIFQFLSKLADLMVLNLLFIASSQPIFTIGASLTALSYVTQKIKDGQDGYVARSFFKSFRQNFKQATGMWLLLLLLFLILLGDFLILTRQNGNNYFAPMLFVIYIGALFWLLIVMYAFPLLAKFENTVRGTLRNAVLLSLANAPKALLTIALFVGSIVLTAWNTTTISWGLLLWLLFGFSAHSYINTIMQYKIFHKFIPEEDADEDPDKWSLDDANEDYDLLEEAAGEIDYKKISVSDQTENNKEKNNV